MLSKFGAEEKLSRRSFLKAAGLSTLMTLAPFASELGPRAHREAQTDDLPLGGLYVLTQTEVLHIDRVGSRAQVVHRTAHGGSGPGRVIAAGEPLVVYASRSSEISAYDAGLRQLGQYTFAASVLDFGVREGVAYALTSDAALRVVDFRDPQNPRPLASISFPARKSGHHLLIRGRYAYVLDNIIVPVYVHLVDIQEPERPILHTLQWFGLNPHLADQEVVGDRWYVLEYSTKIFGIDQFLVVLTATPPLERVGGHRLLHWSRGPSPPLTPTDPGFFLIRQVLLAEGVLLGAGIELRPEGTAGEHTVVGALELRGQEPPRVLGRLSLEDDQGGKRPRASELLRDGATLYLAGTRGIYIIDAADPSQLRLLGLLETESPTLSLAWPGE